MSLTKILLILTLLTTPVFAATNNIYFRMVSDNTSFTFMNFSNQIAPMMQDIAMKTIDRPFLHESIQIDYYQVAVTRGIVWNGIKVVQYDYIPLLGDRFRNVIWLTEDKKGMIKTAIYDSYGVIVYEAICLDAPLEIRATYDFAPSFRFKGFTASIVEQGKDGSLRLLFSDGLNRFSIFRNPAQGKYIDEKITLYGNYVYNKTIDGYIYTIVGTIPYPVMEEAIAQLESMITNGELIGGIK